MKRVLSVMALVVVSMGGPALLPASASVPAHNVALTTPPVAPGVKPALVARTSVRPYHGALKQAATTVPLWAGKANTGGTPYVYHMIGKNPMVQQATPAVTVPTDIVPIKFVFTSFSNATFNPNAADAKCSPAGTPLSLAQNSPVFQSHPIYSDAVAVGTGQYADEFQRANFWNYTNPTGINPNYAVNLGVTTLPEITVPVSGGDVVAGTCGKLGLVDINYWDSYVQNTIFPALAAANESGPTTLPIFLTKNVVFYDSSVSNCCYLGYHSAFENPAYSYAFQSYAVVDFDSSQSFTGVSDSSILSHEVAEWMDDPLGTNPTPSWGNVGQVSGCQANLEVGDPLSGTMISMKMPNGFTYHVQDLAFVSWFYRPATSIGVNGWFSLYGNFLTPSTPC